MTKNKSERALNDKIRQLTQERDAWRDEARIRQQYKEEKYLTQKGWEPVCNAENLATIVWKPPALLAKGCRRFLELKDAVNLQRIYLKDLT